MELNFFYAHKGKYGKIVLNAEELDYTVNYSQFNRYRPTALDPSCFGWLPVQNGGLRRTLPRFYGTVTYKATYSSLPSSLVSKIRNKFSGQNTYSLDRNANFIDKDELDRYTGIDLYVQGDEGKKKVCKFQWAVVEEDDPQHPGQKILSSYYNGLYAFLCPNPDGDLPENSAVGTLSNIQGVQGKYSADAKIALWIITVHDDISGSPSYGQDFKVLVETFSQPTGFVEQGVIMADMRCLTGVENSSNIINGSDPKKNSVSTGWSGTRNVWSSEDTPTVAPNALKNSVNFGEHGIFLYRMTKGEVENLSDFLWSDSLIQKLIDTKYSPTSGIIGIHRLPYIPDRDTHWDAHSPIRLCGLKGIYGKTNIKFTLTTTGIIKSLEDMGQSQVKGTPIVGAQEKISNEFPIDPFFGSFLDFEPYTQISVRLPFIGIVPVPTASCMGGRIKVNYILDNRNGNCVAQILTTGMRNKENEESDKWEIIAQYSGNCGLPMAMTGNSQGSQDVIGAIRNFASNSAGTMLLTDKGKESDTKAYEAAAMLKHTIDLGMDLALARHEPRMFGTLQGGTGPLTDLSVRVMISRPWDVTPGDFQLVDGKRTFKASALLDQKGFASFSGGVVNKYEGMTRGYILGNIPGATYEEMNKIRQLFASGVVINKVRGS